MREARMNRFLKGILVVLLGVSLAVTSHGNQNEKNKESTLLTIEAQIDKIFHSISPKY